MGGEMNDMDILCEMACGPDDALRKQATELELRRSAERRHMFWRERCLEHARTIAKQEQLIYVLKNRSGEFEKLLNEIANRCDIPSAVEQEILDALADNE